MGVIYQALEATSDRQDTGNTLLQSILTQLQTMTGDDGTENSTLSSILAALAPLATAANQSSANTTLASILAALAPLATTANQAAMQTTLAAIQSAMATAANQATANTSLSGIQTTLSDMDSKMGSTTGTISSVSASTTSQSVLPANAARRGIYLYNNTGQPIYIAYAASASNTAFTFLLPANSGYESPQASVYRGAISAAWKSNTTGSLLVTEMT